MQSNCKLSLALSLVFTFAEQTVRAAPSSLRRDSGFASQCTDVYLSSDSSWLVGTCPTDGGNSTISSSVYLPNFITNHEATLQWSSNGAYANSCSDCELLDGGATLYCYCDATSARGDNYTSIDLEDFISVYDGFLLTSLAGAPTVPTSSSSVAIPSNFNLELYIYGINQATCSAAYPNSYTSPKPQTCWALEEIVGGVPWYALKNVVNDGWQIVAYDNDACAGDALVTWDYTNTSCIPTLEGAIGFTFKPLWNANY